MMSTFNFETFPILETDHLTLRRITPDDKQAWLAVWNNPDELRYMIDFETTQDESEIESIIVCAEGI